MTRIKYDLSLMKFISIFENLTGAKIKDCVQTPELLYFVVQEGQIGIALGRHGSNIRRVEEVLNRKIKIVEFNPLLNQFIVNAIHPLQLENIEESEDKTITLTARDMKTRGLLIGRGAQNLRRTEGLIKRYFEIKELRVA